MRSRRPFAATALLALALAATGALAQYPAKAIRIVIPFPPGGGVDVVARSVGEKLSARVGQPVVVENKPGAGTTIGIDAAVKSAPDGYTLLIAPIAGTAIVQSSYKNLSFDVRKDLVAVTRIGYGTIVFVVPAASPAKSVQDVIALAKANPGKLTYPSSGTGALIHLTGEMFRQSAGLDLVHVPYKGTTQILPDFLDGRLDMALDSLPAYLPHIRSGKVRALAVVSKNRSAVLPELPTMAEAGVPGVVAATDYAMYAPAGTPKEAIALLNREMQPVLALPDLRAKLAAAGIEVAGGTAESLQAELAEEIAKWAKVVREAKLKTD